MKFLVYSIREKRLAFGSNGNGGFPGSHAAIVASVAALIALIALIALEEGVDHPAFGAALALALIVVLDASGLRRQVGSQARALNDIGETNGSPPRLRERVGHTRIELAGGVMAGMGVAGLVHLFT